MFPKTEVFAEIAPAVDQRKVTVVGVGQVGMACASSILQQNIANELCLVDVAADELKGETIDLQDKLASTRHCTVKADTDYSITGGSKLCIVTAGACQREEETHISFVQRNVEIFKGIIPRLVEYSQDTCILVVSNPVDVLTYVTWKLSGLPLERVFGSGTNLDSTRFRSLLSEKLYIDPKSCHGWIIGEHGDSSVAIWSVAGVTLHEKKSKGPDTDIEPWQIDIESLHIEYNEEMKKLGGHTTSAIGHSVAKIAQYFFSNSANVFALSTNVKGSYGIDKDIYLSLPVVLGSNGITRSVLEHLTAIEEDKLKKSARTVLESQKVVDRYMWPNENYDSDDELKEKNQLAELKEDETDLHLAFVVRNEIMMGPLLGEGDINRELNEGIMMENENRRAEAAAAAARAHREAERLDEEDVANGNADEEFL